MTAQFDGSDGTLEANERQLRRLGPLYVVLYALVFTLAVLGGPDYEQLAAICDRILIFNRGRVVTELTGENISKSSIARACYRAAEVSFVETVQ